jgi:hypothetical protein
MPRVTIHLGIHDRTQPMISKATPLGALATEALVYSGAICISGPASAMRTLADAVVEAAALAEAYDADPDVFNERERAELGDPGEGP